MHSKLVHKNIKINCLLKIHFTHLNIVRKIFCRRKKSLPTDLGNVLTTKIIKKKTHTGVKLASSEDKRL